MRRPLLALVAGFGISAVFFYGMVALVGHLVLGWLPAATALFAAAAVALLFLVVDIGLFGLRTPMWRRQTPQRHFFRLGDTHGAFRWGLDTGLVVTTFRVTSLTWVAITVSLLGLVPWWAGVCYAAGFLVPSVIMIGVVPFRPDRLEPVWLIEKVSAYEPQVRTIAKIAFLSVAAFTVALAVT